MMVVMPQKVLQSKKGSGSVYLSVVIMLLAFVAVLVVINLFKMHTTKTRAQILCDAIADASAVGGITTQGWNDDKMYEAGLSTFELNKEAWGFDKTIDEYDFEIEWISSTPMDDGTIEQIIEVTISMKTSYYASDFLSLSDYFQVSAKSVVKAIVPAVTHTSINQSFYTAGIKEAPFTTTIPGERNAAYATWVISAFLDPRNNLIYYNDATANYILLYDYLVCMGILDSIPFDEPSFNYETDWISFFSNTSSMSEEGVGDPLAPTTYGWRLLSSADAIFASAGSGAPTIVVATSAERTVLYICVPHGAFKAGTITAAFGGNESSNKASINLEQLETQGFTLYAWTHD